MKRPLKKKPKIRLIVQIFFFVLIAFIVINKTLEEMGAVTIPIISTASLHALCPFGGVVTLYNIVTVGDLIQKIHVSAVILMGLVFLLTFLFGPVFCGWVCPLGSVQEWVSKLGHQLFKNKYNRFIPRNVNAVLRYFRYVILFNRPLMDLRKKENSSVPLSNSLFVAVFLISIALTSFIKLVNGFVMYLPSKTNRMIQMTMLPIVSQLKTAKQRSFAVIISYRPHNRG